MRKRINGFLLFLFICLSLAVTALANENKVSSTITITVTELKPGYYIGAAWDGDELLTLFDDTVDNSGRLEKTIEVGKTLKSDYAVKVGISGINADADLVSLVVYPNEKEDTPGKPSNPGTDIGSGGSGGGSSKPSIKPGTGVPPAVTPTVTIPSPLAASSRFTDVPAGAYYADAVAWAAANGITSGTGGKHFKPDEPCTRGQIVTFLWRAAGSPMAEANKRFADVPADLYYYNAVQWAVSEGIAKGMGKRAFNPDEPCIRGQAVTFLHRANGAPAASSETRFTDVSPDAYYAAAVQWAVNSHITKGMGAKTFRPDAPCTRAQIVTFLYRNRER